MQAERVVRQDRVETVRLVVAVEVPLAPGLLAMAGFSDDGGNAAEWGWGLGGALEGVGGES